MFYLFLQSTFQSLKKKMNSGLPFEQVTLTIFLQTDRIVACSRLVVGYVPKGMVITRIKETKSKNLHILVQSGFVGSV